MTQLRDDNILRLADERFDALIIGGGINGAVSAAALAGRGAKVALIDQGDFAGFTSQHSSNLAWGGIKYMENYEFRLVRQLCKSRNQLMRSFPSTVREIRFLTTVRKGFRHHPAVLWCGAWLYWAIGNGFTRRPRLLGKAKLKAEEEVIDVSVAAGGMEYSDAYLFDNDARFVFNFIRSALDSGATAANYVKLIGAEYRDGSWAVQVRDQVSGRDFAVQTEVLINAAGPFVDSLNDASGVATQHRHAFSKGVHLIVNRVTRSNRVLAFFADDGRLFFVIPMGDKTCIGTTDTRVSDPHTEVTAADRQFILDNINQCLALPQPLTAADVIAERCGVRPLALADDGGGENDWLNLSRKHAIDVDSGRAHVSIFGGKLTDCVNVGEEICDIVSDLGVALTDADRVWYGEPGAAVKRRFVDQAREMHLDSYTVATAAESLTERLWRRYGAQAFELLAMLREHPQRAEPIIAGSDFIRAELYHSAEREMIVTLEDFLRRRSKLALIRGRGALRQADGLAEACEILFGEQAQERYNDYFQSAMPVAAAAAERLSA